MKPGSLSDLKRNHQHKKYTIKFVRDDKNDNETGFFLTILR